MTTRNKDEKTNLQRKLKIEQHEPSKKMVNSDDLVEKIVPIHMFFLKRIGE